MADLRPSEVETPAALNKQGKRKVTAILVFIAVGIVFVFFVKSRRTKQDPVKAAQAKAISRDEGGSAPNPTVLTKTGKIDAVKTAEGEGDFFTIKVEDDKAAAERKVVDRKNAKGALQGGPGAQAGQRGPGGAPAETPGSPETTQLVPWGDDLPPGVAADGSAGASNAPGASSGSRAGRPGNPSMKMNYDEMGKPTVKIPAYDPSEYMMIEGVGLVRPAYLRGVKHPTTAQGHQTFEQVYMASFGSPTMVGGGKDENERIKAVSAGFANIQGGVTPRPIPRKIVKPKEMSAAQIDALRRLMESQGGGKQ